jgi:hypothetical protein
MVKGPLRSNKDWAVVRDGLYYATIGPDRQATVEFLDVGSGRVSEILRAKDYGFSLAASPDEKWILYGRSAAGPSSSELILVENLR